MKMVKNILLGLTAAALVIGFASCKQADDPKDAIDGSGNKYSIDHENTDAENYRAYKSTSLKHSGALVKVKFDKKDVGLSKMGVIFDLHANTANKDAKDFWIIGLGTSSDTNFYVSKFTNVTDIQAKNFGTELKDNPAKEVEKVPLTSANSIVVPAAATDGSVSYYVYFKGFKEGYYEWAVLSTTDEVAANIKIKDATITSLKGTTGVVVLKSGTISEAFAAVDADSKIPQNQLAVYAMVSGKTTLKGSWNYLGMFNEAEEIEE